jgi:hypothetical protein
MNFFNRILGKIKKRSSTKSPLFLGGQGEIKREKKPATIKEPPAGQKSQSRIARIKSDGHAQFFGEFFGIELSLAKIAVAGVP